VLHPSSTLTLSLGLALRSVERYKCFFEHVIRYTSALRDTLSFVKRPVDAEVDATLPVLLLGLRERREAARKKRTHVIS